MEYCNLNCEANRNAFNEIVDKINEGGGGGSGVTKLTITTETELYDALDNANDGDSIVIRATINNGSYFWNTKFSGIVQKGENSQLYIIGYGLGKRTTGTVNYMFWQIHYATVFHNISMYPINGDPWQPLRSIENINATMIKF